MFVAHFESKSAATDAVFGEDDENSAVVGIAAEHTTLFHRQMMTLYLRCLDEEIVSLKTKAELPADTLNRFEVILDDLVYHGLRLDFELMTDLRALIQRTIRQLAGMPVVWFTGLLEMNVLAIRQIVVEDLTGTGGRLGRETLKNLTDIVDQWTAMSGNYHGLPAQSQTIHS